MSAANQHHDNRRRKRADVASTSASAATDVDQSHHSSSHLSSPMLIALLRDSGSHFSLCTMLTHDELATLHTTCHSWRHMLDMNKPVQEYHRSSNPSNLPLLLGSKWILRRINSIDIFKENNGNFLSQGEHI